MIIKIYDQQKIDVEKEKLIAQGRRVRRNLQFVEQFSIFGEYSITIQHEDGSTSIERVPNTDRISLNFGSLRKA